MTNAKPSIVLAITLGDIGGAQNFILGFACWLKAEGYSVTLLVGDGVWLEEQAQREGIPTMRLRHMGRAIRPWRDFRAFLELRQVLRSLQPDVVHLNSTKMGVIGSLAARCAHIPRIVYRIGGWVFLEPRSWLTTWLYRTIERVSARWKDVIVCVHPQDTEIAHREHITPKKRIVTVPNGIEMSSFSERLFSRQAARTALHLPADPFIFGTVAGFFPAKDLPRYVEACHLVHAQYPDVHFTIIGDGEEREKIESARTRLGLTTVMHLPGHRDNQGSQLLSAFDAFVLPSSKEGMPWALLEAMAARLPCLATDVGANAWMLENRAGWIVPSQNPIALAKTMITILQNPEEASQRAERAQHAVMDRFPLNKTYQGNLSACLDERIAS